METTEAKGKPDEQLPESDEEDFVSLEEVINIIKDADFLVDSQRDALLRKILGLPRTVDGYDLLSEVEMHFQTGREMIDLNPGERKRKVMDMVEKLPSDAAGLGVRAVLRGLFNMKYGELTPLEQRQIIYELRRYDIDDPGDNNL